MCGCSSRALVRASRTNRSASPGDGVSPRSSTFTATSWPRVSSRTRNTAAKPPSPKTSPTVNFLPRAFWRRRRSVTRSSDMADAKPRNLRRAALGTAGVVLVWLFAVWPPPVWWRDHWPRETAMMREGADWRTDGRAVGGSQSARPAVHPTDLESISPVLQRMVIIAEDSRCRPPVGTGLAGIASHRGAGGRARGHAAASAHLEPHVPPGPHAGAPRPHPGEVSRRGRVHPAGRGNRLAAHHPAGSCGPARARFAEDRRTGGQSGG